MLGFLPSFLRGVVAVSLLALNTLFWCTLLFAFALVKLVLPFPVVRRRIDPVLNGIATLWIACNSGWMRLTQRTVWDVEGVDALRYEGWYLVNCNHQSWADIFVLQHLLNRRVPMLKFFLKQQLIYVPVIGLAWWALDFPFMKRHGKAELRKRPELRTEDAEATRRACEKFALVPTSVMNFAEGTRLTAAKHRSQSSPYRHLLKPKAGALALALNAMGEHFHSLIDVTIVYPGGAPNFWEFVCGKASRIVVRMRELPIPAQFCAGDYSADPAFRIEFQRWLAGLWEHKDGEIDALLGAGGNSMARPRRGAAAVAAVALALGLGCLAPAPADAVEALKAPGLRAKYAAIEPQLRNSPFKGPLLLDSMEAPRTTQGDAWGVVEQPFATVSAALTNPANWCDILIIHLNNKYCRGSAGPDVRLQVRVGRKHDQPLEQATLLTFAWRAVDAGPEYFDVEMAAPEGPYGTRDYHILVEAVPLEGGRTFIHMAYAFGFGAVGQFALSTYLATVASDKVGFSTAGPPVDGKASYVGGARGLVERNTMRYYLAIGAYLQALSLPPASQPDRRFESWFDATEKFPAQLHEIDRAEYLAMKQREYRRQKETP